MSAGTTRTRAAEHFPTHVRTRGTAIRDGHIGGAIAALFEPGNVVELAP